MPAEPLSGIEQSVSLPSVQDDRTNNAFDSHDGSPLTVTLIKIDETIMDYLENVLRPVVKDGDKSFPVPILYANPERWKSVRKDGVLRDKYDKLQVPIILVRRTAVSKNTVLTSPVNKYLLRTYVTGWNRHNSYDRFNVMNRIQPPRELITIMSPDYVDLTYEVILWTEYITQMNALIEQINFEADEFWGRENGFKYRVTIQEYSQQTELPSDADRIIKSTFLMTVKAYLLPEKSVKNDKGPIYTTQKVYGVKKTITFVESEGTKIDTI